MESKRFAKNVEDFTCAHCGAKVSGSGYTDHCPSCLYSMHVDVNPGDRKAKCGGLMKPVSASSDRKWFTIYYVCTKCWAKWSVRAAEEDNQEMLYGLIGKARRPPI
ncbi:MAG TPA: RNHCP domain-containing protein [Candidatus Acidoferrales bacterium]|nr:RNHCP domain-containing protein [Candidatus Acidoferrales bacterium]